MIMGHTHTPNGDTFHASFTQIDDGDAPTASNFNVPTEAATDNAAYLKRRALMLSDHDTEGDAKLVVPLCVAAVNESARFTLEATVWLQTSVSSAGNLVFEVQAPVLDNSDGTAAPNCYVADAGIYLIGKYNGGAAGHAAGGIASMTKPKFTLYAVDEQGVSATIVAMQTDPQTTAGGYDAMHTIGFSGLASAVNVAGKRLILSITGETGTGSIASTTEILGAAIMFSCTDAS